MGLESGSSSSHLVLSFFGDKGLWDNLAYIPAYPSGMTYFRPFRYTNRWIEKTVLQELQRAKARKKVIGQNAILAVRFSSENYEMLVLPLRIVKITHIDFIPDNVSVYFQLGRFCLYDFDRSLREQCLTLPSKTDIDRKGPLFFRCKLTSVPRLGDRDRDREDEAWINWTEVISGDESLPFNDGARRSVFIRISGLREREPLGIEQIHRSWSKGPIHGFVSSEAKAYELMYLHRAPFLFRTGEIMPKFKVKPVSSTSNWEFSNIEEEVSGNYQLHVVTMTALAPSASWEQILLLPDKERLETKSSGELLTVPVTFNIKIKKSWWYRFCTKLVWIVLLGVFLVLKDVFSSLLKDEDFRPDLFIGFLTFVILLLGYVISQKKLLK